MLQWAKPLKFCHSNSSSSAAWPWKTGPIGCPKTSLTKYQSTLREKSTEVVHTAAEAWNGSFMFITGRNIIYSSEVSQAVGISCNKYLNIRIVTESKHTVSITDFNWVIICAEITYRCMFWESHERLKYTGWAESCVSMLKLPRSTCSNLCV
jgi:hypothetical protein